MKETWVLRQFLKNDLYLEQVIYKKNGVSQNIFYYLILYSLLY